MTPKILHFTWKVKKLPDHYQVNVDKWVALHPDYQVIIYDDDDLENVIETYFPQYLEKYRSFGANIERVDFARYAILHQFGGVYADLDTFPLKRIDRFLEYNKVVLGKEPYEHTPERGMSELICNALMISPPGKKIWIDFMDYIVKEYDISKDPVLNTGPVALTKFYRGGNYPNVLIEEPCTFFPICNGNRYSTKTIGEFNHVSSICNMEDTYVVHQWTNSWVSKVGKFGLFLANYYAYIILFVLIVIVIILNWYTPKR